MRSRSLRHPLLAVAALVAIAGLAAPGAVTAVAASAASVPAVARDVQPATYPLLPGAGPVGIAVDQRTGEFYVSRFDGAIDRGHVGSMHTERFLPAGSDGRTTANSVKLDRHGRLYVTGGASGRVDVYDTRTARRLAAFESGRSDGWTNDVAIAPNGDAYVTDSFQPVIYRIPRAAVHHPAAGTEPLDPWLDVSDTIPYDATAGFGFNLIGADVSNDGRYLFTVTFNSGHLYRIDLRTRAVVEVDLGGQRVFADGIVLQGRVLHLVDASANRIDTVRLDRGLATGTVVSRTARPEFDSPTKIAAWRGDLLVNNSQIVRTIVGGELPVLPYTVSRFPAPSAGSGRLPTTYSLPGDDVFPEGIAVAGRRILVGSYNDGAIYRGRVDRPALAPFVPAGTAGMTQAVGLKADRGRLVVAGGVTGKVFTFNARTGRPLVTFDLSNGLPVGTGPGDFEGAKLFVNDVAVAPNGDVYVTDSIRPVLFRIPAAALRARPGTTIAIAPWLSLTGTPAAYTQALNLNGIEVSDNGRHLLTVHSLSGELFRVAIATGDIVKVDLGAGRIFGDGLLLRGRTLHSVTGFAGSAVDTVSLSADLDHGRIVSTTTAPTLDQPSTATFAGRDLLVVNFQVLRAVRAQPPNLPFTLTRIPAPTANDKHPHDIGGTR